MRKVGIVASGSTVVDADVILNEGEEKDVKAEDLVTIENRNGNRVMAVCRTGVGSNENLRVAPLLGTLTWTSSSSKHVFRL